MTDIEYSELCEKQKIELAAAEIFLCLYNKENGTHFEVTSLGDTPDVNCEDKLSSDQLDLEITLLEDRSGDIQYLLDREEKQETKSLSDLGVIGFERDVIPRLIKRLDDKLLSSYGENTALVIRQVGPLWSKYDWSSHAPELVDRVFEGKEKNYGKGVWIICSNTSTMPVSDDIFCLFDPSKGVLSHGASVKVIQERVVGKVTWERFIPEDFTEFAAREDVDPIVRIESPHGCEEAILIAFVKDEPEAERKKAIESYRDHMKYHCPCGRGMFRIMGNWIAFKK